MGITPVFIHLPLGFFSIQIAIHFGARGPAQVVMEKWVDVRSKKARSSRSSSKQKLVAEKTGEQFLFWMWVKMEDLGDHRF